MHEARIQFYIGVVAGSSAGLGLASLHAWEYKSTSVAIIMIAIAIGITMWSAIRLYKRGWL